MGDPGEARCLDLGSGAGLPGLPLALAWPASTWVLLDAAERRCVALVEAVDRLGLGGRVVVHLGRAEEAGRDGELRSRFDLVVARAFGAPAVVAECAAPFLRVGGRLVVSEPPEGSSDRWPADGVGMVGLAVDEPLTSGTAHLQLLRQVTACPDRYPRRTGVPTKRPLF